MNQVYTAHNNVQCYHEIKEQPLHSLCWSKVPTRQLVLMVLMTPAASCVQTTHLVA